MIVVALLVAAGLDLAALEGTALGHLSSGDPRSEAIYPPQRVTLRYDHGLHAGKLGLPCVTCHASVYSSERTKDYNIPPRETCLGCHPETLVTQSWSRKARAADNAVAIPRANLHFSHAQHLALEDAACETCHAGVEDAVLAGRDHLPSMETCLTCHDGALASADCRTCHLSAAGGTIRVAYASGLLVPDDHGELWLQRHEVGAKRDLATCASCHAQDECLQCHAGSVVPVTHGGDYLALHPQDGWANAATCLPCHRTETFCLDCHRRAGVVSGERLFPFSGQYHPDGFVDRVVSSLDHHSLKARKNLAACTSCHDGSSCTECHAYRGSSVHGPGWRGSARERRLRRESFETCLECHSLANPLDPINDP